MPLENGIAWLDAQCVVGMILAVIVAGIDGLANMPMMFAMFWLYSSLIQSAPSPFYNFQWDILLLEIGLIGACWAPCFHRELEPHAGAAPRWLLCFTLFKLMLMSGVVKITEGDASWTNLTAIWYHFATQCIPTPLAWYFHNLPMPVEKFFCAVMFVIEVPAAFLLLAPGPRLVRCLAALLQVALMLMIILTGNFTFFNLLYTFVALVVLDDSVFFALRAMAVGSALKGKGRGLKEESNSVEAPLPEAEFPVAASAATTGYVRRRGSTEASAPSNSPSDPLIVANSARDSLANGSSADGDMTPTLWLDTQWRKLEDALSPVSPLCQVAALLVSVIFLLIAGRAYGLFTNHMTATRGEQLQAMSWLLPNVLLFVFFVVALAALSDAVHAFVATSAAVAAMPSVGRSRPVIFAAASSASGIALARGFFCLLVLLANMRPLTEIAPNATWPFASNSMVQQVQPFVHPYGLFRSMTGIGAHGHVARPEIVIEVSDAETGSWYELAFPSKPGRVDRAPPVVAPYQPRLDWQMWFQALEGVEFVDPDGWYSAFLSAVLSGQPAALRLLDRASLPERPISGIRSKLYHYRFTGWSGGEAGSRTGLPVWWKRRLVETTGGLGIDGGGSVSLAHAAAGYGFDPRPAITWFMVATAAFLAASGGLVPRYQGRRASEFVDNYQSSSPRISVALACCGVLCCTILLVIASWLSRSFWVDLIAILVICSAGLLLQVVVSRAGRENLKNTGVLAKKARLSEAPGSLSYGLLARYGVLGLMALLGLYFRIFAAWVVFGAMAIFGFLAAVLGLWGTAVLSKEAKEDGWDLEVSRVMMAAACVDSALCVLLFVGQTQWAS